MADDRTTRGRPLARRFRPRSQAWGQAGVARQPGPPGARGATPVRTATGIGLVVRGWAFARAVGRGLGPLLFRRLAPETAGTVGFVLRLGTITVAVIVALRIAGIDPSTLAVGGAVTAVVL